jgi:hypothetical protein
MITRGCIAGPLINVKDRRAIGAAIIYVAFADLGTMEAYS